MHRSRFSVRDFNQYTTQPTTVSKALEVKTSVVVAQEFKNIVWRLPILLWTSYFFILCHRIILLKYFFRKRLEIDFYSGSTNSSQTGGYYSSGSSLGAPQSYSSHNHSSLPRSSGHRSSFIGKQSTSSRAASFDDDDDDDGFYDNIPVCIHHYYCCWCCCYCYGPLFKIFSWNHDDSKGL